MKTPLLLSFVLALAIFPSINNDLQAQDTFYVNSTLDDGDSNPGDGVCSANSGGCTFRAAIEEANEDNDVDNIFFDFPGATSIAPGSSLPIISTGIDIDGSTMTGASCPTSVSPANLLITLDGVNLSGIGVGLHFTDGFSSVKGLNIVNHTGHSFATGIRSESNATLEVYCNHIGINNSNTALKNTRGIEAHGLNTTIGGELNEHRNVISGNEFGIRASSADIRGNFVGTTLDGLGARGNETGIFASDNSSIGTLSSPNKIAFNEVGIRMSDSDIIGNEIHGNSEMGVRVLWASGGLVSNNSIYDNGQIGIDIMSDDVFNSGAGPNIPAPGRDNNAPTLWGYQTGLQVLSMHFQAAAVTGSVYTFEVFHNDSCDPSGFGEGKDYIETFTHQTVQGNQTISKSLSVAVPSGKFISVTATNPSGETSEFSNCLSDEPFFIVNSNGDTHDSNVGDSICADSNGECTIRAVIEEINAGPAGENRMVSFDFPGVTSVIVTSALGPLPNINRPVTMDATNLGACSDDVDDFPIPGFALAGPGLTTGHGLVLASGSDGSKLMGIQVADFPEDGFRIESNNNDLFCVGAGNLAGNDGSGIALIGNGNDLGGPENWKRVYSVNNGEAGVEILGNLNDVWNSFIGTDGSTSLPNIVGVLLDGTANFNSVGSYTLQGSPNIEVGPNVISGNANHGIHSKGSGAFNSFGGNIVGLGIDGASALGNGQMGIFVESPQATIGQSRGEDGVFYDTPNTTGSNLGNGIGLWADDGLIRGNYIGLTKLSDKRGNGNRGISLVGDDNKVDGNFIGDNSSNGIIVRGSNNEIYSNWIGQAPDGSSAGNTTEGINIGDGTGNLVGNRDLSGTSNLIVNNNIGVFFQSDADFNRVEGNEIRDHAKEGIVVSPSSEKNFLFNNTITGNGLMSIDVNNDNKIDPDDAGDADAGGNDLMNRMSIDNVNSTGEIELSFHGEANVSHFFQIYAMDSCPASNLEIEGQYPGRSLIQFTTDSNGDWNGGVQYDDELTSGSGITALVSNSFAGLPGSTSEFADCVEFVMPFVSVVPFLYLSGPHNGTNMNTLLNPHLPDDQPYNTAPWNYSGTESLLASPSGIVDWVLLELRTGTAASTMVDRKAGLLLSSGEVVFAWWGSEFDAAPGNYYIVVYHRNHLPIMSATPQSLDETETTYDFRGSSSAAFGTNPMNDLGGGLWGMWGGDGNSSNDVSAFDFIDPWLQENGGTPGYRQGDFNMNGTVSAFDFIDVWLVSNGRASQVPE